ncbi:MAG: iclR-type protein [Euryarchaeota archaeon]|nr:iclR-type protein [Euryarchaeota archaeon]
MKCSDKWSGKAHWKTAVTLVFVAAFLVMSAHAQQSDSSVGQSLILNVYLDNAGKALVTGYAEDVSGLAFLADSQFRFENDSHQLYALTDRLTAKVGDLWTLSFEAIGSFDDYRVTFYLPSETSLGEINASLGLGYLLSASNESLVADVQGYEVSNPRIIIQYRQLLAANGSSLPSLPPAYPGEGAALIMLLIAAALMMAGFGFAVFLQRKRRGSMASPIENGVEETIAASLAKETATASLPEKHDNAGAVDSPSFAANASSSVALGPSIPSSPEDDGVLPCETSQETIANGSGCIEPSSSYAADSANIQKDRQADVSLSYPSEKDEAIADVGLLPAKPSTKNAVVVSSEMEAVMQTLTARERAVMSTLIDHGGRMTQADIRYDTGTPKSSLTGILISLERRKLVSKKEWGRTNIIELSDWFLSKKEHS